jgi:hypothetical protein
MKGGDGGWRIFCLRNVTLQNIDLTDLLVGVGIPSSKRSGSSALRGELGARRNLWIVCVAPLRLGGLRGKKSTPSIGWEVP